MWRRLAAQLLAALAALAWLLAMCELVRRVVWAVAVFAAAVALAALNG